MYQILICSVLYSIVAKEKVWTVLGKFLLLFRRELKRTLGKESECRVPQLGTRQTITVTFVAMGNGRVT